MKKKQQENDENDYDLKNSYCVKCRKMTPVEGGDEGSTSNDRPFWRGECPVCHTLKTCFLTMKYMNKKDRENLKNMSPVTHTEGHYRS